MIAKDLITDKIPPLHTSDTGLQALALMDEYRVSHLPIVNDVDFLGLISEEDIFEMNHFEENIGNHHLSLSKPFVTEDQHIFEVIKLMADSRLSLVPVLNQQNSYMGVITEHTLVEKFADLTAVRNPGGIIVLELNESDYSLSQIAQIIESNDARVLSMYMFSYPDSTKLEVTVKINKMDLTSIIQTFNRYDYIIKASFSESEYNDFLKDRFDALMTYLNI